MKFKCLSQCLEQNRPGTIRLQDSQYRIVVIDQGIYLVILKHAEVDGRDERSLLCIYAANYSTTCCHFRKGNFHVIVNGRDSRENHSLLLYGHFN